MTPSSPAIELCAVNCCRRSPSVRLTKGIVTIGVCEKHRKTYEAQGYFTPWMQRVQDVTDQAHAENWGGDHREGFCKACADAYLVAQHAVPGGPGE